MQKYLILFFSSAGLLWGGVINIANARSNGDHGGGKLDRLMWGIRGTITRWPSHNLF